MKRMLTLGIVLLLIASTGQAQSKKRIVSLATSITQNLYLLEANKQLVGCTQFCNTLPQDSITIVADALNVNLEKIVALQPDIVLASELTSPRVVEGLKQMGIQTIRLKQPKDFEEICSQFIELGKITGTEERAKNIVERCQKQLQEIKQQPTRGKRPKVFMEIGSNPLYTALPTSFMHDYIVQAGGENIAKEIQHAMVSKEFVVLQDPDIIFIVGMGIIGKEEMNRWNLLKGMRAVQEKKIFLLGDSICSPTPETFVKTVKELNRFMYPPLN